MVVADKLHSEGAVDVIDPRIRRSRRMLLDSLVKLLNRKAFDDISIQEIADEATLNRATFYLHYADKNALLQALTVARFRGLVAQRGLAFSNCDGALRAIALGVCDYLSETTGCPGQLAKLPLEGSIVSVVESVLNEGSVEHKLIAGADPELVSAAAAWAIFGAARRWYQTADRIPAEEMALKIESLVRPIFLSVLA